ncbi:MAG: pyrroline-5-carboxylate reductase [Acidimicrobiia bacterium]
MSSVSTQLAILGGGKMGEALLAGLLARHWAEASDLTVVEVIAGRRDELSAKYPGVHVVAALDGPADGLLVAVKPGDVEAAVGAAVRVSGAARVLSIAAGVPTARIEAAAGRGVSVVRAMPNTAALVGAGAAAIAAGSSATTDDLTWAESILGAVGKVVRVPEHQLDAVTGLSGSGPAYVFLVAEALIEAGVLVGLTRDVARTLAVQTLLGSARLLDESGDGPEVLRAAVTSPGGTTAAGLRALEKAGARSAILDAVVAATDRSRELGA